MNCANCGQKPKNRCHSEGFDCTGGRLDPSDYALPENQGLQNISEQMRAEHGNAQTRLEEIIEFAERSGFARLGIAFCIGLAHEAAFVASVLQKQFKVDSVCCKMSGLNKDEHGMAKIHREKFEVACNPIGQARMLNRARTDLNIQMGLCLGHDILFQKYSEAPVTVLVVKDRAMANNPMGVAYGSYWRQKFGV
ncbi:MAG: metal-binding protein [Deltaproteobacteria bacterium CG_4_10_14_3_um_filter_60_8]|nr:MAG: metal-binding protein [Deltaproteobacteria bacterium CG23_combo_of_CG06-09_8_20_14_all_60_8]PIY21886.1 MAG: metal-binding protein [Deltaproteobacteria bacterium CG_4_10_14_3_um_filter_60_8]